MNRRTVIVAFGAALVLLALWFMFLWGPQGGRLKDAEKRQDAAEAENSALELRLARLQAVQERAPELMAELEELRRAVPDDPELAQFILDANDAATDSGVDFISISPGLPEPGVGALPPVINLSITVRGSYVSVLDYLRMVDDLRRIVVVDSLNLTPEENEGVEGLSVAFTARMFATSAPLLTPAEPAPTSTTTTAPPEGDAAEQVTTSTSSAPDITVSANG